MGWWFAGRGGFRGMMKVKKTAAILGVLGVMIIPASYAQEYNVSGGVSLDEFNARTGLVIELDEEARLFSPWDRGSVVRYSGNESNPTGFGRFVEVEYDAGFEFEGSFMSQGVFSVIFSNVKAIHVDRGGPIGRGELICTSKTGEGNGLRALIVSKRGDLRFLEIWSGFPGIEYEGYWYWNPMFLFPDAE
jgi:hypothetical protein